VEGLTDSRDQRRIERAVILAAGRGTRLGRLTADRPKPLIPVRGRPVLEHIVAGIAAAGIRDIVLVVGYRREQVEAHFGDGSRLGVAVRYAVQETLNGTGGALAAAEEMAGAAPFLLSFGDILTDPGHYQLLLDEFSQSLCEAVLGINPVEDPALGAAVYLDGERVVRVVEKPPPGTAGTRWNLAGVYAFSPAIFHALRGVRPSPRGEIELTSAIGGLIESGACVRACRLNAFWSDIGSLEALARAEALWPFSDGSASPRG